MFTSYCCAPLLLCFPAGLFCAKRSKGLRLAFAIIFSLGTVVASWFLFPAHGGLDVVYQIISLIAAQKVILSYCGNQIQPDDRRLPDYLRKKTEINKSVISRRPTIPEGLLKSSRKFLKEYFNVMDLPDDEDGLTFREVGIDPGLVPDFHIEELGGFLDLSVTAFVLFGHGYADLGDLGLPDLPHLGIAGAVPLDDNLLVRHLIRLV